MVRAIIVAFAWTALAGCTHRQLAHSTVQTASTVMDIKYRAVLMNLAMLSVQPETLPSHVRLGEGVVQVNDEIGFGTEGGFTALGGQFGIEQYGPSGSRQITEQWGLDAVGDPLDLKTLQDLYRMALGLPPLPDPEAIRYVKRQKSNEQRKKEDKGGSDRDSSNSQSPASPSGGSPLSSEGGGDEENVAVPVEVLLKDVPPPGWYYLGCKHDVPKDACYVGCYGGRYVWVMPEGIPDLARFTLIIQSVLKYETGDRPAGRGLAVSR